MPTLTRVHAISIPIPIPIPLVSRSPIDPSPMQCLSKPFPRFRALSAATAAAPRVVVADDDKYGNKQVVTLTPQLYDYILSNVREPEVLRELREETASMRGSQMQVSPDQAQLLAMLVQVLGARRCIEVGVYTVEVQHALAADTLRSLILKGEAGSYDFAFVDAEKRTYDEYFELLLQLVRVGGLIVMDNVLWHGKVADPQIKDRKTISIRNFNKKILEDQRVSISMAVDRLTTASLTVEAPRALTV